jgi:hypothetical protein
MQQWISGIKWEKLLLVTSSSKAWGNQKSFSPAEMLYNKIFKLLSIAIAFKHFNFEDPFRDAIAFLQQLENSHLVLDILHHLT